jgi:hypothetical protein
MTVGLCCLWHHDLLVTSRIHNTGTPFLFRSRVLSSIIVVSLASSLLVAIWQRDIVVVKQLLEYGADLWAKSRKGESALVAANESQSEEMYTMVKGFFETRRLENLTNVVNELVKTETTYVQDLGIVQEVCTEFVCVCVCVCVCFVLSGILFLLPPFSELRRHHTVSFPFSSSHRVHAHSHCQQVFMQSLVNDKGISDIALQTVFCNLPDLYSGNSALLADLKELLPLPAEQRAVGRVG